MRTTFLLTSVFLCLSLLCVSTFTNAQCTVPAPPTAPLCGAPGQVALTSGTFTNSGTTYYYSGTGTLTGVSIASGATIVVCGNLTLTSPNMYGGTLFVQAGGTVKINVSAGANEQTEFVNYGSLTVNTGSSTGAFALNATFYNYGMTTFTGTPTFNTGGLYNGYATSSIVVSGDLTTYVPVVNNGSITVAGTYRLTSSLCLGGGSQLGVTNLHVDENADGITVSPSTSGTTATIGITGTFNSDDNAITTTSNLSLCEGPSINSGSGSNKGVPGSATVKPNCTLTPLPVTLLSFTAETGSGNICTLNWVSSFESGLRDFEIEYSLDGRNFLQLGTVTARNEASSYDYSTPLQAKTWFRLRMVNDDNTYVYSAVVLADYQGESKADANTIRIQPNLITGNTLPVWTNMQSAQSGEWIVVDMMGRTIFREGVHLSAGAGNTDIQLPAVSSGMYRLVFLSNQLKPAAVPFSVIR